MKKSAIILLHIGYWTLYLLLIVTFLMAMANKKEQWSFTAMSHLIFTTPLGLVTLLPAVLGFYSFYSFLFSRYLNKRKLLAFFAAGIAVVISCGILPVSIMMLTLPAEWRVKNNFVEFLAMIGFLSMLALINGIIGLVMRGFITWYGDIRLKEELQRRNYETELALIKSQLNPHFLFNTINNIDVLIEKNPEKASAYLNKLSGIMRFMLYETKAGQVPLAKELEYIEKYIELQRIRTSNSRYVEYVVKGEAGNRTIEPMLFIPFIENAFKHSEYKKNEDAVKIGFVLEPEAIHFRCENRYIEELKDKPDAGGLGNELIRRRLELLYPGKHSLHISKENGFYKVVLIINEYED
jgi:sensor histidine kinase YesM